MSANKLVFTPKRRLSPRDICGDIKKLFKAWEKNDFIGGRLHLFSVGGLIFKSEVVPNVTMGDSDRMIGDFKAVNRIDGSAYRSNRLFLPDIVTELILLQLNAAKQHDPSAMVQFAYDLFIIPDEKSAIGYVYVAETIIKNEDSDAMKMIDEALGLKALPAPK